MSATVKVAHMVCPSCARMNGQEHLDGCPDGGEHTGEYADGWGAARDALLPPLADEIMRLRDLLMEHHAAGVLDGALLGDKCPVCTREGDGR